MTHAPDAALAAPSRLPWILCQRMELQASAEARFLRGLAAVCPEPAAMDPASPRLLEACATDGSSPREVLTAQPLEAPMEQAE